ncbi:hypothetical protein ACTGVI_12590, partial [Streptococcus suis]
IFLSRFRFQIVDFSSEEKNLKTIEPVGLKGVFFGFGTRRLYGGRSRPQRKNFEKFPLFPF